MVVDVSHYGCHGLVDTALQVHGVGTCGDVLESLGDDGLCEDGGSSSTITCIIASLACHALDELCAGVLKLVLKLHLLGYGHAVLRYLRSTELLLDNHVAALRTECHLHCVCQLVYTSFEELAGIYIIFYFLCHDVLLF